MTVHQCPKCELRFEWPTELEDHCRTDHPQFHHDYPVRGERHNADVPPEPGGDRPRRAPDPRPST